MASAVPEGRRYTKAVAGMRVFGSRFAPAPAPPVRHPGAAGRADSPIKVRYWSDYSSKLDDITRRRSGSLEAARGKLDDREGAPRRPDPPGPDAARGLEHPPAAIQEQQIEWKPHERGVDGRARRQDQRLARAEPAAAEETLPPGGRVEGTDDGAGHLFPRPGVPQPVPRPRLAHQRSEAMSQGQSVTRIWVRKRTGRPSRVAGRNCHVLAAATSIRS
jgi:hypothetical protein